MAGLLNIAREKKEKTKMNQDIEKALKSESRPIFIWGAGEVGKLVFNKLEESRIPCKGFVVDDQTENTENMICSKKQLLQENQEYILVRGVLGSFYMSDAEIFDIWPGCKGVYSITDAYEPEFSDEMSEEYYENHRESFQLVRDNLEDEFSKKSLDAYLEVKIKKHVDPILPYVVLPQYFFNPAPWVGGGYNRNEILIDGGSYTGDSILDFVKEWSGEYAEIIACEPDSENCRKLEQTISDHEIANVTVLQVGLYSENTIMRFHASGDMMSTFSENGEVAIQVDAIDNFAAGKEISIIKMDIEGSELDALTGAKNTIQRCRPMLMISAYHKKDDLFNIFRFINDIVVDYKYYFRCHKPLACDAVLYAVPVERVKDCKSES